MKPQIFSMMQEQLDLFPLKTSLPTSLYDKVHYPVVEFSGHLEIVYLLREKHDYSIHQYNQIDSKFHLMVRALQIH